MDSHTIPKDAMPQANRFQRRAHLGKNKSKRLLSSISSLTKEMVSAGIEPKPFPKVRSRKYLSGYMSKLVAQATA